MITLAGAACGSVYCCDHDAKRCNFVSILRCGLYFFLNGVFTSFLSIKKIMMKLNFLCF